MHGASSSTGPVLDRAEMSRGDVGHGSSTCPMMSCDPSWDSCVRLSIWHVMASASDGMRAKDRIRLLVVTMRHFGWSRVEWRTSGERCTGAAKSIGCTTRLHWASSCFRAAPAGNILWTVSAALHIHYLSSHRQRRRTFGLFLFFLDARTHCCDTTHWRARQAMCDTALAVLRHPRWARREQGRLSPVNGSGCKVRAGVLQLLGPLIAC